LKFQNTLPPLSLYIHIPWCIRKCPYCDFNSYTLQGILPEKKYIDALLLDLKKDVHNIQNRSISSIFIGGGTPSLLSPDSVYTLLTGIQSQTPVDIHAEITLEANPSTVDNKRFVEFRQAGINRLSLGIQSFEDTALEKLGRIHRKKQAISALESIQYAGFDNFNLDLMFGLPAQSVNAALKDLEIAVIFQPPHLSWYQLTLEQGTAFYENPPILPDDDSLWEMQTAGQDFLATQAYAQYEISAYSKSNKQCQHNLNYWQFGDYLGIGAGAHSKITDINQGIIRRFSKHSNPNIYLKSYQIGEFIEDQTRLNNADICLEFMMNALRLHKGFSIEQFSIRTGLEIDYIDNFLQQAFSKQWLIQEKDIIRPSQTGLQFLNELLFLINDTEYPCDSK